MLITQAHFGSNIMYSGHGTEPGSALDRFSTWMGATNFRYPGGTVTEQMSHRDGSLNLIFEQPNRGAGFLQDVTTLREALEFANARNGDITFVLPTTTFLTEGAYGTRSVDRIALNEFLERVEEMIKGVYGPPLFRTFEIGNEWWLHDQRMTANEYGLIANEYAKGLKRIFDEHRASLDNPADWIAPNIAVQSGAYWRGPESNTTIIRNLDSEAKAAINMVIAHFYPHNLSQAQGNSSRWNALQEFKNDAGFGDIKILFSEWNISTHSTQKGMNQASLLIETFATMIERGVDEANIWGTNYKNLSTKLAKMSHNRWEDIAPDDVALHLMPAGEVYRMLARNLVGKTVLDLDIQDVIVNVDRNNLTEILLTQAFGSDEQITVFISNRGTSPTTFRINDSLIPRDFTHVWAEHMTAHDDPSTIINEGDPTSENARALVSTRNSEQLFDSAGRITLNAHDIIRLSFTKEGVGVEMNGNDQIVDRSLAMSDHLIGGLGNDTIRGEVGDDILQGRGGDDLIYGGDGNDWIDGGSGNDTIYGGEGDDSIGGGPGNDLIFGVSGANKIWGGRGDDSVHGGSGNDTIHGVSGSNRLFGNGGDDLIFAGSTGNYIDGGLGNDTLRGGDGADTIYGGLGHDDIGGGAGDDTLYGNDGDDTIYGGLGRDWLEGGHGDDLMYGGGAADTLLGGEGNDTLYGGAGSDRIEGASGDDILYGDTGADFLLGGAGQDQLLGGSGADTLDGGGGNDTLVGGSGRDLIFGGTGSDLLNGGSGNDMLDGGSGDDTLFGASGDDLIDGGTGDDVLEGGNGRDTLIGGQGNDTLAGGWGADVFVFGPGFGHDIVTDFENGIDRFDFRGHGAHNFSQLTVTNSGENVTIFDGLGNSILVRGAASLIDAGDFLF